MSKYTSSRPCSRHGSPVERYVGNNGCCLCHADSVTRYAAKRQTCTICGSPITKGYCKTCRDAWVAKRQTCTTCGGPITKGYCKTCRDAWVAQRKTCPTCGGPITKGYCKPCRDAWVAKRQTVPCDVCGCTNRDSAGKCKECTTKLLFSRPVPSSKRAELLALIRSINMQYGVTEGSPANYTWGGVEFNGRYYEIITCWFEMVKSNSR